LHIHHRPISLITAFPKTFEKVMHKRVIDFLNSTNTLANEQFGFLKNLSMDRDLLSFKNKILHTPNGAHSSITD
jgi:hypothetical protein